MSSSCAQWRGEIGAYIVGALDGYGSDRVARHLAACGGCRADYDELLPARHWLAVADRTAGRPEPSPAKQPGRSLHASLPEAHPSAANSPRVPPSQGSGTRFPEQPTDTLRASRSRTRRWLPAAGAALAAVAAAVAVMVSSGAPVSSFSAADSATGVSGHAQLHGTPAGTQIDLTATGLRAHQQCILVAVARSGTDIAGSWDVTYDGSARITATTAFAANKLTALRIESDNGALLLSIRV